MPRIFASIAISETLLLGVVVIFGLQAQDPTDKARHVALAVFAALLACVIHAAALTYFSVTGKLIKQSVELGKLHREPLTQARDLKRRVTRLVGIGMLAIIVAVGTGAYSLGKGSTGYWHLVAATVAVVVNIITFYRQYDLIVRNSSLLGQTMKRYRDVRQNRLDVPS